MNYLLHEENLSRIPFTGEQMRHNLALRAGELASAAEGLVDPGVTVVIRSQNDAGQLPGLFEDIAAQDFAGQVEVVLVDTESTDGTREIARKYGATVVPILQEDFNYPMALNRGFEAASYDWVLSLVGHSALTNNQIFHAATRSQAQDNVAGVSGIPFPNANATWVELTATAIEFPKRVRRPAEIATKQGMGFLATNTSMINRRVWEEVGKFDESYGAGGEDSALARAITKAGYPIVVDPGMSVFHSHEVGLVDTARQIRYWLSLDKPRPFDRQRLAQFRADLR